MQSRAHKILYNRLSIPWRPFYRRYPYRGGVSLPSADGRGIADPQLRLFCNRIPKAANSTVTTTLARMKFGPDIPARPKKSFMTPAQLNTQQVAALSGWYKFAIVRNPYTRTLSAYLDKIERHSKGPAGREAYRAFITSLERGKLYSNAHWAPQSDLLLLPLAEYDVIGKVERLDADMTRILQRLRPGDQQPLTNAGPRPTGARDKLLTYYDDDLIARVQALFARDFEAFGYATDFPS